MTLTKNILKLLLNLKYTKIVSFEIPDRIINFHNKPFNRKELHIRVEPYKAKKCLCPKCLKKCPGYDIKSVNESSIRTVNLNGIPVYLEYKPVRIECKEHGVLTEYLPWSDGESRFSKDFNNEVAWMATHVSKSALSEYFGINWRTVGNCIKAAHQRIEPDVSKRLHSGLKRIAVDETSSQKGYKYITVVYDLDTNQVVWVHDKYGEKIFRLFCEELSQEERDNIEIVAGDGARWIDSCTKEFFKNSYRCLDPFHLVEWANEAIDKVRMNTVKKANDEYKKTKLEYEKQENDLKQKVQDLTTKIKEYEESLKLFPSRGRPSIEKKEILDNIESLKSKIYEIIPEKEVKIGRPRLIDLNDEHLNELDKLKNRAEQIKGSRYALCKNPENRTENQSDMVSLIENSYPDLYKAYQLKESLRIIIHMKDSELASYKLKAWIEECGNSNLEPMVKLSEKINRHFDNIINSITYGANSSKLEATNTTIKTLIKIARGFRNIDNMISMIYLVCSSLVIPLNNRPQISAEEAKEIRDKANMQRRKREEISLQLLPN